MNYYGQIRKMTGELTGSSIAYHFNIADKKFNINNCISKDIKISFDSKIHCIQCDKKIKKTFMQGYCYPCFMESPKTTECNAPIRAHASIDMGSCGIICIYKHTLSPFSTPRSIRTLENFFTSTRSSLYE